MFTGIVETTGSILEVLEEGTNKSFLIESNLSNEFKIDQSISHSGVCLTVDALADGFHRVTAIAETLDKTNLDSWVAGRLVNIERCLQVNGRLDGHLVQGHVDCTASCLSVTDKNGSWELCFRFPQHFAALVIEKGSICLNGISLTIFNVERDAFTIAVIPYTWNHTNIREVKVGHTVNLEFDMVGKYINRRTELGL